MKPKTFFYFIYQVISSIVYNAYSKILKKTVPSI